MAHSQSAFFEIPKDLTAEEKDQIRRKEEELKSRQGFFLFKRVRDALILKQNSNKGLKLAYPQDRIYSLAKTR